MQGVKEGFDEFSNNSGAFMTARQTSEYVEKINSGLNDMFDIINQNFSGSQKSPSFLKGDVAEYWHWLTFNADAIAKESEHRVFLPRVNGLGSPDIISNFGKSWQAKYYSNGETTARALSVTPYLESKAKLTIEEFAAKYNMTVDETKYSPLYKNQIGLVADDDQLVEEARIYLRKRYLKELSIRPQNAERFNRDISTVVSDNAGVNSKPASNEQMVKLAEDAKKGIANAETMELSPKDFINMKMLLSRSLKAGITAAEISAILQIAPVLIESILKVANEKTIDEDDLKRVGTRTGVSITEGFLTGSVAACLTEASLSGMLGDTLKNASPEMIGAISYLAMCVIKDSILTSCGKMSAIEFGDEVTRSIFSTLAAATLCRITSVLLPGVGLAILLSSFVGSILGSVVHTGVKECLLSLCVDSGFTLFGLVKQDYKLPEDLLKSIGVDVLDYESAKVSSAGTQTLGYETAGAINADAERVNITVLKRGLIKADLVGYLF